MSRLICKQCFALALVALLLACASIASAQQTPGLGTDDEVSVFVHTYYQRPRPEMIEHLMGAAPLTVLFQTKPNSRPAYIGFFSEVFAVNSDRLAQWREAIAKQGQPMKAVLEQALAVKNAGGVMAIDDHSASIGDMYWGAFFASGRADFVNRLIGELRFIDERVDFARFGAGATAKWALASNAQSHSRVRAILEASLSTSDKRTQEIITDLLQQGPAYVRQEIKDIAEQRWAK